MRRVMKTASAIVLALAATAAVIVTQASAETSTRLCKVHTSLVCPEGQETTSDHLVLVPGTVYKILNSLVTVLCLNRLALSTPLELGKPQSLHSEEYVNINCGTNSTHTNCIFTTAEQPLWTLLKTGLDEGSQTATSGLVHVVCNEVGFFKVKVDCIYNITGVLFARGVQHLTAEKTPLKFLEGSFFCPENATLDFLMETLEPSYVLE
jgi:hypothetical protein